MKLHKIMIGLQGKIILLVCSVVAVALVVTSLLISRSIEQDIQDSLTREAMSLARIIAKSPVIVQGLSGVIDVNEIQRYANESKDIANVQFIVVLDMNGIRKSHPNPAMLGEFLVGGDGEAALSGQEYISRAHGTLGYSLRAFTPVYAPDGRQIGVVLVGILMKYVEDSVRQAQTILLIAMGFGMLVGILGAWLLAQSIKRTLFGLEPEAIAKQLEERSAMLSSVREGIIAIDNEGHITLFNEEAKRLFRLARMQNDPTGQLIEHYIPNTRLPEVVKSGQQELNCEQDFYGISILTNRLPLIVDGKIVGAIATYRDKTEMKLLAEELTGVRLYVEALRSQAHEFMNKLHVILGLVQLESYDQVASYINRIASDHQAEVSYVGKHIRDPVLAGFILSKLSLAREKGVVMELTENSYFPNIQGEELAHELVTIIGNLIENAFDAVKDQTEKYVKLAIYQENDYICIDVQDTGEGIPEELGESIFERGITSKAAGRGIGLYLVKGCLERLGGFIEFTSESSGTVFLVRIPY